MIYQNNTFYSLCKEQVWSIDSYMYNIQMITYQVLLDTELNNWHIPHFPNTKKLTQRMNLDWRVELCKNLRFPEEYYYWETQEEDY